MDPLKDPQQFPTQSPNNEQESIYGTEHKVHVAPVRSFSTDLANAIREKGGSVVRIAIAEDEKHRREFQETSATSQKNIIFIVAAMLIVIAALSTVVWVFVHGRDASQPVVSTTPAVPTSLINAEDYQVLDFSGMKTADALTAITTAIANATIQSGTVKNLVIVNGATRIPAAQFLTTLGMHAPSDLSRSLSPQYMLGMYNYTNNSPFLIIQGTAHDYLLSGMLTWEPKLFNDMTPLFGIDTSALSKTQLQSMPFTDLIIENHDTRAVLDSNGKPMFFYSFLDQDTIVFATDPKTLTEVVRRY